jgi:hypothetical protein
VVVVVTVTVVTVVAVVVVRDNREVLVQPLLLKVQLINIMVTVTVTVTVGVVVVVVMMVVVVVVVVVMVVVAVVVSVMVREIMLDFVLEALIHELLEFDTVLVVLQSPNELVVDMILGVEPQLVTLQLVLQSAELRVVVVAVVAVTMVVTVVVGVMHREVDVNFLCGDLRSNVCGLMTVVVVMTMGMGMGVMSRNVIRVPSADGRIVTNVVLRVDVVVSGGQGGGETEDGDRDDLCLHFDCSCGFGVDSLIS